MTSKNFMSVSLGNKSIVKRIIEQITNAIIDGQLKPGDKIPTESELASSFEVGRNSVREAIKILEAYGVLEIKRADGTYVCQKYDEKMLYPILYGIILQKDSKEKIIELRKVIDVGIFYEVINKITKEKIDGLKKELKILERELYNPDYSTFDIFEADVRFHSIIVDILDNPLLKSIGIYIDKITRQSRLLAIDFILKNKHQNEFLELHKEIIWMFEKKLKEKIEAIVEEHYKYWEK